MWQCNLFNRNKKEGKDLKDLLKEIERPDLLERLKKMEKEQEDENKPKFSPHKLRKREKEEVKFTELLFLCVMKIFIMRYNCIVAIAVLGECRWNVQDVIQYLMTQITT